MGPRENEERFRLAFEKAPIGMCLVGHDFRFRNVNQAMCRLIGYAEDELIGLSFVDITHPDDVDRGVRLTENIFRKVSPQGTMEKRYVHKNGAFVRARVTVSMVDGPDGEMLYGLAVVEDLRPFEEFRRTERLASVGILASGIAHELNNPVGGILLAAQSAIADQEGRTETVGLQALRDIEQDARRCAKVIKSLLRLSRDRLTEKRDADLNGIVKSAQELTRAFVAREATLTIQLAEEPLPGSFNVEELEQALIQLLRNAVESGATKISIKTERVADGARLIVADDGRGLSGEEQRHLFDPFYTKRRMAGALGLGLATTHATVLDHGGEISVASERGVGTRFTIDLPSTAPGATA